MGPFIKSKDTTNKIMIRLLISLSPLILFSFYKNGIIPFIKGYVGVIGLFYPLIFIILGVLSSFIFELIYSLIFKKNEYKEYLKESYSIFPGLFLSMILPLNTPIYILIIGVFVAILSKILSGGFGKNIFNPALIGYLFIVIIFSSNFSTSTYFNKYELDTISSATPLTNSSLITGIGSYDDLIKPYGRLLNFFIGTIPGSLAETSALLCLIGFIYLTITKTIKWRIPVIYVSTVFLLTYVIGSKLGAGLYYPLFQILSGGLMFGSIYMATDPVTSTVSPIGQILQGLFLGILTVLFRFIGTEGVAFSILIMNLFVPLLDKIGSISRFNIIKSLIPFLIAWILAIILCLYAFKTNKITDSDFKIISKDKSGNTTTYIVTQKGYGGNIKGEIVFENDKIISFKILSNHETKAKYDLVIQEDYLNKLIENQESLENIDTVSSATVTSTAIKKMVINTIQDYK
jgi:electron transport complex protein RnfD